MQKNLMILKK